MEKISLKKQEFNNFRFEGLNAHQISNKYLTMNRKSNDDSRLVVKVDYSNIRKTQYGYLLILNNTHVVFLKDWQVSDNYFGTEVLIDKKYFNVKEFGNWEDFGIDETYLIFENWVQVAEEQSKREEDGTPINQVRWEI